MNKQFKNAFAFSRWNLLLRRLVIALASGPASQAVLRRQIPMTQAQWSELSGLLLESCLAVWDRRRIRLRFDDEFVACYQEPKDSWLAMAIYARCPGVARQPRIRVFENKLRRSPCQCPYCDRVVHQGLLSLPKLDPAFPPCRHTLYIGTHDKWIYLSDAFVNHLRKPFSIVTDSMLELAGLGSVGGLAMTVRWRGAVDFVCYPDNEDFCFDDFLKDAHFGFANHFSSKPFGRPRRGHTNDKPIDIKIAP
jgi:hypothetical protein